MISETHGKRLSPIRVFLLGITAETIPDQRSKGAEMLEHRHSRIAKAIEAMGTNSGCSYSGDL